MKNKMNLEELEYSLPLTVQHREKKVIPCPDCKKDCNITVTYEQRLYRSDSYWGKKKTRTYEISFVGQDSYTSRTLFRTERYHSLREALLEAHEKLEQMGLKEKGRQKNEQ